MAGISDSTILPEQEDSAPLCPECKEVIELDDDGTIPLYCEECGAMTRCPDCGTKRKVRRNGQYVKRCGKCSFVYPLPGSSSEVPAQQSGKLFTQ